MMLMPDPVPPGGGGGGLPPPGVVPDFVQAQKLTVRIRSNGMRLRMLMILSFSAKDRLWKISNRSHYHVMAPVCPYFVILGVC